MIRLSDRFKTGVVKFLALTDSTTDGAPDPRYPDISGGVVVAANVQGGKGKREVKDGVERFEAEFVVTLLDDPAALNGGSGVRRGDAFVWSEDGRLMVARHDAVRVGSCWPVKCLAEE